MAGRPSGSEGRDPTVAGCSSRMLMTYPTVPLSASGSPGTHPRVAPAAGTSAVSRGHPQGALQPSSLVPLRHRVSCVPVLAVSESANKSALSATEFFVALRLVALHLVTTAAAGWGGRVAGGAEDGEDAHGQQRRPEVRARVLGCCLASAPQRSRPGRAPAR